ncbi:MAG: hypothetical protein H7245_25120 [Candidatus Saccharibacteria bacterium]|nr:hypothetical protein [Pseudorhodobacter sp.]
MISLFVARQIVVQTYDLALLDMPPCALRSFAIPALLVVFFMLAAAGMMTLVPVILQPSDSLTPLQTGLFMLTGGLTITAVSIVVGRYYGRLAARPLMVAGAIIDGAGLWFLSKLAPDTTIWLMLATNMLIIIGQVFLWTATFAASIDALSKHILPHGSAIIITIQRLSGAAGLAIACSIMTATTASLMSGGTAAGPPMTQGAQHFYLVAVGMIVPGLVVALMMPQTTAIQNGPVQVH